MYERACGLAGWLWSQDASLCKDTLQRDTLQIAQRSPRISLPAASCARDPMLGGTVSPLLRALALAPRTQRPALSVVRHVSDITSSEIARRREEAKKSYDATAGKPSAICDPYDNKGEPLSESQCAEMLLTVGDAWTLLEDNSALVREIEVTNFMRGAKLLTTLAAVSFNDGHFPTLTLERRKGKGRRWQEVVHVKLQTVVLEGLSYRDFQLAVLMDVELARPV